MNETVKCPFLQLTTEYLGNALFLFFIIRVREGGMGYKMVAHWLKFPLDDVYGALPGAAEHTALKEAFFQAQRKSSRARTPLPSQKQSPAPPPLQTPSSFLCSASPGHCPSASCGFGRQVEGAPAPVLTGHLFSSGTDVCCCWQGGAENWRGAVDRTGEQTAPWDCSK